MGVAEHKVYHEVEAVHMFTQLRYIVISFGLDFALWTPGYTV